MPKALAEIVASYDPDAPLDRASTIPGEWYTDNRVLDLERQTVFARSWQVAARVDQLRDAGSFVSCELPAGEPVVVVRGADLVLRGFFNVCRHHAAAVVTEPSGTARLLRCPYHGWTYGLDGALKGTPDFAGVCGFDRAAHGLVPVDVAEWEGWVLVRVERDGPSPPEFLGADLMAQMRALRLDRLAWVERRVYRLACNWKVFVDNYLDGGYHVPHLHKALDSVLDYTSYTIENGERFCLQSSPLVSEGAEEQTRSVRAGDRARYYWIYPNFMINSYAGAMDTNLVIPLGLDTTEVVFDFYFEDASEAARSRNAASVDVSERIQDEDVAICESVQRGLRSRAYGSGRLSVRREAGEQLFHRLLCRDLRAGLVDDHDTPRR
jgi:choline monooxygenase